MRPTKKRDRGTQERLLESACVVFAQKGYRNATIAEICDRADANIAAVNYHFGDKETLYVEAWRVAFERSLAAHPPDGGVPDGAAAEERLRGRILALMRRIADPKSHEFEIVHKELANPTGLLVEVMRESIEPIRQGLGATVRELLGPKAPRRQVLLCMMSIRSQCFDEMIRTRRRRAFDEAGKAGGPPLLSLDIEEIAAHIARFSLAGIREIRRQIDGGEFGKTE